MSTTSRQQIFAQASLKLRKDFEELSVVPHNALKGGEAEKLVRTFLKEHLPKRFDVGGGFIIDRLDNVSKQTDVIIYDALNCPVYRASEDAGIFPSDNVAATVEVKSRLDKNELIASFNNILATKKRQFGSFSALLTDAINSTSRWQLRSWALRLGSIKPELRRRCLSE